MPVPIVEPTSIQRAAEPGETVTQDFVVNILPNGTLSGSILGGGSIIRLRHLIAYQSESREYTEEEINELPPFPPSIRLKARQSGYLVYNEVGRVGSGQPLTVWNGLLVKGEIEFAPPQTEPPGGVSAILALDTNQGRYAEIPLLLIVGKIQIDYATPVYAHQGQKIRLPVTVTFPPDCPAATITLNLDGPHWAIPMRAVTVPAGASGRTTLELHAASTAPLGSVSTNLRVKGFDGPYDTLVPFQFEVKPFSQQLKAAEEIEAKALVLSEGPPGPRLPVSEVKDAGNGGFVQEYSTGNIYWHPQSGAKWVYGAILAKYLGLAEPGGFLGYPLTDETGTPDGIGRYNHFQGGSIYSSAVSGAHEIHGKIRDHWAGLGWEKSYLGYPTFDQKGKMSRFQRGTIEIRPVEGIEQTRDEPDTRIIHTGTIHTADGDAVRASAGLTINSLGDWHFSGSMTATGAPSYDVALGIGFQFKDFQGRTIAFLEEGAVEGFLVLGGSKWHEFEQSERESFIRDNWDALRSAKWTGFLTVNHGPGDVAAMVGTIVGTFVSLIIAGHILFSTGPKRKACCRLGHEFYNQNTNQWEQEKACIFVPVNEPCPPDYPLGD